MLTTIKGIWNEYIITIENGIITTRNLSNLIIVDKLQAYKNIDCLVFNGNVIIFDSKNIFFYSIPNLQKASSMTVSDNIISLNIVNKKTFIVLESKYVEQFETKTWKRLWRQISLGDLTMETLMVIGAGKKLFFYSKVNKNIYQTVLKRTDDNKKGK